MQRAHKPVIGLDGMSFPVQRLKHVLHITCEKNQGLKSK